MRQIPEFTDEVEVILRVQSDEETPNLHIRSLFMNKNTPFIFIGRMSKKNPDLKPGPNNGWIESPVMSRQHALLRFDCAGQRVLVEDAGSTHGTFRNETLLTKDLQQPLEKGDTLRLGVEVMRNTTVFSPCTIEVAQINHGTKSRPQSKVFRVPDGSEDEETITDDEVSARSSVLIVGENGIGPAQKPNSCAIDLTSEGGSSPRESTENICSQGPNPAHITNVESIDLTSDCEMIASNANTDEDMGAKTLLNHGQSSSLDIEPAKKSAWIEPVALNQICDISRTTEESCLRQVISPPQHNNRPSCEDEPNQKLLEKKIIEYHVGETRNRKNCPEPPCSDFHRRVVQSLTRGTSVEKAGNHGVVDRFAVSTLAGDHGFPQEPSYSMSPFIGTEIKAPWMEPPLVDASPITAHGTSISYTPPATAQEQHHYALHESRCQLEGISKDLDDGEKTAEDELDDHKRLDTKYFDEDNLTDVEDADECEWSDANDASEGQLSDKNDIDEDEDYELDSDEKMSDSGEEQTPYTDGAESCNGCFKTTPVMKSKNWKDCSSAMSMVKANPSQSSLLIPNNETQAVTFGTCGSRASTTPASGRDAFVSSHSAVTSVPSHLSSHKRVAMESGKLTARLPGTSPGSGPCRDFGNLLTITPSESSVEDSNTVCRPDELLISKSARRRESSARVSPPFVGKTINSRANFRRVRLQSNAEALFRKIAKDKRNFLTPNDSRFLCAQSSDDCFLTDDYRASSPDAVTNGSMKTPEGNGPNFCAEAKSPGAPDGTAVVDTSISDIFTPRISYLNPSEQDQEAFMGRGSRAISPLNSTSSCQFELSKKAVRNAVLSESTSVATRNLVKGLQKQQPTIAPLLGKRKVEAISKLPGEEKEGGLEKTSKDSDAHGPLPTTTYSTPLGVEGSRGVKRLRRAAEFFGYATLGGVAVMSALIATAPTL